MLKTLLDLFVAFFRSSILSYGGGPASIPLIKAEVVENYRWMSNEQFADALALGNALPGPIAPKMAAYVGHYAAGVWGAVVAIVAAVVPTAIAIILLAKLFFMFKDSERLKGMLKIAKPLVVVMLLQASIDLMTKANYPKVSSYIVSGVAFVLLIVLKINPSFVMLGGLVVGFVFYKVF